MLKRAAPFYMDLQAYAGNKDSVILIAHLLEAFFAKVAWRGVSNLNRGFPVIRLI
jgi:hypothetical protein